MSTTFLKLNVYCYQYFCKQVAIICHSLPTFPARGTWIEMPMGMPAMEVSADVPRKGNVDRNRGTTVGFEMMAGDVPRKGNVDRNIPAPSNGLQRPADVPRKGNVDRNFFCCGYIIALLRRSPQGERG